MSTNEIQGKVLAPLPEGAINLTPPAAEADRKRLAADTRQKVGVSLWAQQEAAKGIVAMLVLLLRLAPSTKDTDAITALDGKITFHRTDKDGHLLYVTPAGEVVTEAKGNKRLMAEVVIPKSAASKARTVHSLLSKVSVSDSASEEYRGAVALAEQRGDARIKEVLGRKQPETVAKVLRQIAAPTKQEGETAKEARNRAIKEAVPNPQKKSNSSKPASGPSRADLVKTAVDALVAAQEALEAALAAKPTNTQRASLVAAWQSIDPIGDGMTGAGK